MKKLYLFIFLIVIGCVFQIQSVNAHTTKLLSGKIPTLPALRSRGIKAVSKKIAAPVITFTAPGSKALTNIDFIPVATTTCTLPIPITFTSSNPAVATIVNGNIHYIAVGTANITASQGGGTAGTATLPKDVTGALIVTAPTLALTAPGSKALGTADFALVTTQTLTNVPVTFTSSNPSVATVTNGNVHLTGIVGTSTITASQGGGATGVPNLLPADVTGVLTVTAPVLTFAALGSKPFSLTDLAPGATSTVATPAIAYSSSNPAVATISSGAILTLTINSPGVNYTPGTYTNVPLTGGAGTGATANIIVTPGGAALPSLSAQGKGYNVGDVLSITPASLNNSTTGSGFSVVAATTSVNLIHYVSSPAAPNNTTIITATQGGGLSGTATIAPDVQQVLTVTQPTFSFPTLGARPYTTQDYNPNVTSSIGTGTFPYRYTYLTSSNPAVATIITTQTYAITAGALYVNGTYPNVPLVGGTGTGMTATIVVASGSVTTGSFITNPGTGYSNLDVLSIPSNASLGGTGSGFYITLTGLTNIIHYNNTVPAAPNNTTVITASMGGGVNGTTTLAPDVSQVLTLTAPAITFPPLGTRQFTSTDINPGASGALIGIPVTYTSSNPAVATIVNGYIHFTGAPAAPNNTTVITASQVPGAGINLGTQTLPASVSQTLTVTPPTITFPTLGSKNLGPDFNPGATSTITNTPIIYTSSNPAVATVTANGINSYTTTSFGAQYKTGTYVNIPLTGGTGTGALATITVTSFGSAIANITNFGSGYTVGDVLTFAATSIGSTTGVNYALTVTGVSNMIHFVGAPAAPNNTTVITASQGGGATGTTSLPANVSQTLTVIAPAITFPALGTKQVATLDFNTGATSTLTGTPITYTSSNSAIATIVPNAINTLTTPTAGSNYVDGTYNNVPLTGGTGTGVRATVVVLTGAVTTVTITTNSTGYSVGDVLTAANTSLGSPAAANGFNVTVSSVANVVHFVGAPSATNPVTITASQGGGATGTPTLPADVAQVLTVTPASITFAALGTINYPGVDFYPVASSTITGTAITYTSSNTAVATVVSTPTGPAIHLVGAPASPNNTTIITASQGGGATGTATLPADVPNILTVLPGTVAFTFPPLGTRVFTNVDIAPGASSPLAGVPITYSSSNPAIATIVNGKIHLVSAPAATNTVTITVSQGGGAAGTLTIPPDASQVLTITPPTLTFPAIGAKQYSNVDFNPGATSSITNIPVTYTSSNPNVATVNTTILLGNLIGGSGYVSGTYNNVSLTGGTGSGLKATVIVAGGSITAVNVTSTGILYTPGDILSAPAVAIGGIGSGFSIVVSSFYSLIHMVTPVPAAPNNTAVITASLGGGATGTASLPADVSQTLTVVGSVITFPAIGTKAYTNIDFAPGATSTLSQPTITYTSSNTAVATITNSLILGNITTTIAGGTVGGTAYTNGTYTNVPLTGGTGSGALATVVVSAGSVTSVTVTTPGILYTTNDVLSAAAASLGGGAGTGFGVSVASYSSLVHLVYPVPAAPNNTSTITATQGGGAAGTVVLPANVSQVLTVTAPTFTFPAIGTKVFTTVDFDPAATSTVPGLITYTSSDATGTIATIVNNKVHLVGLSTTPVTITAFQNGASIGSGVLTSITAPTLALTAPGSKVFTTTDFTPVFTSTLPAIPVTYTSSNTAVATIVNGNIHYVGAGTATITASQTTAAAAAGLPAPANSAQTLTVTAPALTLAVIGSKAFQTVDLAPVTTTTLPTIPITFTSSNTAVATIVNGNIHFVGLGTANITASQSAAAIAAGLPAPPDAVQAITVVAPTFTFAALGSKAYSSTDFAFPVAVSSLGLNAPITYTSDNTAVATTVYNNGIASIHYVGVGVANITASTTGFGNIAAPASVTVPLTVTPATIAFTALGSRPLNSLDVVPTVTPTIATTVVPVIFTSSDPTVATIVVGAVHMVGIGTATITASQAVTGNYAPAPVTSALTVTAVPASTPVISFTAPLGTKVYTNSGDIVPPVTSTLVTPISYTSSNPLVATILNGNIHLSPPSIINGVAVYPNPNTTVITASQGGGANGVPGLLPADVSQTLTVTPAVLTFPALGVQRFSSVDLNPGASSTYTIIAADNTAQPIAYTSSNPAVATIVNSQIHFVGLGATVITASQGNVIVPDVSQTMVVVAPAITFPATATKVYSTADVPPGATSTLSTTIAPITFTSSNTNIVSIVNGNLHFNGVGVVSITASQAAIGNSTVPPAQIQVLTVTPPAITLAATRTQAFSTTDLDPGATSTLTTVPITYTSSNPSFVSIVNGKLHFNLPATPVTNSPIVTITATQALPAGSNYFITPAQQVLTVTQAIIIQNPLTKYYGDPDFSPGISTIGYPVSYTSATATVAIPSNGGLSVHIVAPGTSILTATQAGDATNVAAASQPCTLTVAVAPLIITPKSITRVYGIENPIPYPIIYSGFRSASGTAPLDDSTKFTAQPFLVSVTSNANPTVNLLNTTGGFIPKTLPVGTYSLVYGGATSTFYSFSYGTGTLTITPTTQALTFDQTPITKKYGDPDFDPLARSTGDPVVYTSSDPTIATIVNGKVHITGVGVVTITATLSPTSGNFTGSGSLPVQLTVIQGTQTITASTLPFIQKGAAATTVNATASSGLPVVATISDQSIAKSSGLNITGLHIGTTTVTLSQPGNAFYTAAPNVVLFLKVVSTGEDLEAHLAVTPNNDGINDFLLIEGVQDYPGNHVSIINRNGIQVYQTTNYNNKDNVFVGKSSRNGDQLPAGTYFYRVDYNVGDQQNHITGYFVLKY